MNYCDSLLTKLWKPGHVGKGRLAFSGPKSLADSKGRDCPVHPARHGLDAICSDKMCGGGDEDPAQGHDEDPAHYLRSVTNFR